MWLPEYLEMEGADPKDPVRISLCRVRLRSCGLLCVPSDTLADPDVIIILVFSSAELVVRYVNHNTKLREHASLRLEGAVSINRISRRGDGI